MTVWNVPNVFTLLRVALIPLLVVVHYLPFHSAGLWAAGIFVLGAVTDWLDGYLARRLGQTSAFGRFLDPVADKLLVACALVLVVQAHPHPALAVPALVIIAREVAVSALREWMAEVGQGLRLAVTRVAKYKTAVQMLAITLLLMAGTSGPVVAYPLGVALLYVAVALTLWSMGAYLRAAWPSLRGT